MIYLDNSATTKAYDEVIDEMTRVLRDDFGNPSSLHRVGFDAEKELKRARAKVKELFPKGGEIVFTSGGTESDNLAIIGAFNARKRESNRIITTKIEHPAVLETVKRLADQGAEVVYIDVDSDSRLDLDQMREEVVKGAAVVSVMAVNNETGALMPLCHVADIINSNNENLSRTIFHTDAVQAFGKEDVVSIPCDIISVSGHKIHGPKGIGALYLRDGINIPAQMLGGGQEKGLRSGTENMPGIIGLASASEIALDKSKAGSVNLSGPEEIRKIRNELRQGIMDEIPDVRINSPEDGSPYILNVSFLGTRGEVILHTLEQDGIMVSTGAACSSGKNAGKSGSHVLKAMGLSSDTIEGAIRISFGSFNTLDEVPFILDKLKSAVTNFRRLGSFR